MLDYIFEWMQAKIKRNDSPRIDGACAVFFNITQIFILEKNDRLLCALPSLICLRTIPIQGWVTIMTTTPSRIRARRKCAIWSKTRLGTTTPKLQPQLRLHCVGNPESSALDNNLYPRLLPFQRCLLLQIRVCLIIVINAIVTVCVVAILLKSQCYCFCTLSI